MVRRLDQINKNLFEVQLFTPTGAGTGLPLGWSRRGRAFWEEVVERWDNPHKVKWQAAKVTWHRLKKRKLELIELAERAREANSPNTEVECETFQGDSLGHVFGWKKGADLAPLVGRNVKLKFYLQRSRVFSFQFSSG